MKMLLKKTICILLAFMLAFGPFAEGVVSVFARNTDNELAPNGQTWEEAYPNGAFIFKESYLYSEEGDDTVAIAVYRMGGRDSRAVANLAITPVTPEGNTANAAGINDFDIISPEDVEIDPDNEYDTVFADLVFEEGEYVKSLEIRAIDDNLSEPEEFFIVTIYGAEDAEFLEDGNRFTMCIQDNDPYVKSLVSFAESSISFDKSEGSAILEVVRTGGTQYVFSVDYETVSGTAIAGVDFAETSGTLLFNCGEERASIEIPLINDNNEDESMDISFKVKLSNPKGGDIAEDGGEAEVYLYNTAKEDAVMNTATLVADLESIDISGKTVISDDAIISNNEEITVVPEIRESTPLVETAPAASKSGIVPMAVVQDGWGLAANQGGWKKYTRLAYDKDKFGFGTHYDNSDDFYGSLVGSVDNWHTRSARSYHDEYGGKPKGYVGFEYENENRVWKVFDASDSDPYGYAIMKATDLDGLYEFYKSMSGHVSIQFNDIVLGDKNQGMVLLSNNDADYSQLSESSREEITAVTHTSMILAQYTGQGRNESVINLSFSPLLNANENFVNYDRPVLAIFDNSWENNTYFRTWVDDLYLERAAINNLRYEVVCKDGDGYLSANSNEILNRIKPVVSIYNNEGGTNGEGKLYAGSRLLLNESASSGAFRIKNVQLKKLVNGVWTTINTGEFVNVGEGDTAVVIQLRSDDNSKIQRTRELSCRNAETDQYSLYVEMERNQRILLDYSPNVLPQDIAGGETDEEYIIRARRKAEQIAFQPELGYKIRGNILGMPVLVDGKLTNTYMYKDDTDAVVFDFNLKNGEAIAYDGDMYYGPVPIKVEDYAEKEIYMIFYDSESMSREQEVRISSIESAEMYIDNNGNGIVDAGEPMVGYVNDDRYVNSFFDREDGKQKLLKYDYVLLPRKINTTPADDTSIRYDLKASFVTTATSNAELDRYTDELKAYREIETGNTKVPIYGVEAMKGSITVPLGGDMNPPTYDKTSEKWSWDPDFEGNLKTPFTNPDEILYAEKETVAGPKKISGIDEINDYIGSFRNSDQVVLQLYNNNGEMVDRYDSVRTYREIVLGEFEQNQNLGFDVPEGGDTQDTPGAEKPKMELPQIDIPAGPFKVVLDGNRAGFELGIPLIGGGNQKESDKNTGLLGKNASKYLDDMKDAVGKGAPGKNIFDQLKNAAKGLDDTGKALKPKADVDASFMFGFSASFMWEYDEIEAQWEFDEAKIFVTFNGEVKISQRLPPLPIVYVYIIFSADVEVGLNIEVDYGFDAEGLRTSQVTCTGDINLEIEVEAGVGVGVELCKFEIFLKINTGLLIKIAATAEASGVDEFSIGAALGFRAVFLCFSYEMEAISFELTYEKGRTPEEWDFEWKVFGQGMKQSGQMGVMSAGARGATKQPRTGLRISGRAYDDQTIGSSRKRLGIMSITPEHGDFELGEYNAGASSKELVNNLRYSSDYKLFSVSGENYILYMIDGGAGRTTVDADMLVLSKIDASGNLINPVSGSGNNYTVVDKVYAGTPDETNDPKGDSAFDVHVDGTRIVAAWIDNRVVTPDSALEDPEEVLKNSAANTQIKYTVYDTVYADQGFGEAVIIGIPDDNFNFLPKTATVGDKDVVLSIKAEPYTEAELNSLDTVFKNNLIEQIRVKNGLDTLDEAGAKTLYPYFNFKTGNFRNMNILYGKYSTFSFGVEKDGSFIITEITPNATWQSDGTRVEQADIYPLDNDEFYLAYTTSYNYLEGAVNMTAKRLYLRKGVIDGAGNVSLEVPLLLRSLVDSEDDAKDGIYEEASISEAFIDPFFSGLEFMEGKLDPEGSPELMLLFNMNNRYYVIDNENLEEITDGDADYGVLTPFFELGDNTAGDGKGDFSIGLDGDGNISAVYTSPVPYTNNNAIYMTKYDPNTGTWGKGIMLAMRGMSIYENSVDEGWTEEAIKEEYYKDTHKLVFQKPKVVVGNGGSLLLVSQTALTELEEMTNPITGDKVKMPAKDGTTGYTKESTRGFYTMSFPVGTRTISSPSLILDNKVFVPGSRLTPRVTFKNVGDFAIRGSADKPLMINLMHGDGTTGISLAEWSVKSNIPSGGSLDTLLHSEDTVYGQIGTQLLSDPLPSGLDGKYLYFTVKEDASYTDAYNYNSLDTGKPEMEGVSWYLTDQDKAELVLEDVSIKQGGEIITINGVRYLPLDINATVKNYGGVAADANLEVKYRETTTEDGEEVIKYNPVASIGNNGTAALGIIGITEETNKKSFITNNNDYTKDTDGKYIVRTDGTLEPYTANDLLVPLSYFDNNAADPSDKSLKLRFEVIAAAPEFDKDGNNIAFAEIPPIGSIKMDDRIYLVPNTLSSFGVEVESSGTEAPDIILTELQSSGGTAILTDMSYDNTNKQIKIISSTEGESILRVADKNTAAYKDVIVKATAEIPGAPAVDNVLPRNGMAYVYFTPPSDTGGVPLTGYIVEARNINDETDVISRNSVASGRYEFTGLTNGKTYRFRVAAKNVAGTGPWSEWPENVTPAAAPPGGGEYAPMDAKAPNITLQPVNTTVALGGTVNLEIEAETDDGGILSYQWYKNLYSNTYGGSLIEGATGTAYSPPAVQTGTVYYYCIVTNTNDNAVDKKSAERTSSIAGVTVGKGTPHISLNTEGNAVYGEPITLTAIISGVGSDVPTGTIRFESDYAVLEDLVPIINGRAEYTWENASAGAHKLRAVYNGDNNYGVAEVTADYNIAKADQEAIEITGIPQTVVLGSGPYMLSISGGSGTGAVSYNVIGNAVSVDENGKVTVLSLGQAIITAVKAGDSNYNEIQKMLEINVVRDEDSGDGPGKYTDEKPVKEALQVSDIDWTAEPISIDLSSYSTVSAEVLKKMADMNQSRDIIIKGNGYTITFKKGSIKNTAGQGYIDFGMTFSKTDNDKIVAAIHFNHSGKLPGEAEIKINIGKEYAGQTLYYYYKNKETGELEYMQRAVVDEEGFVTVIQSSCSDYVFADARIDVLKKSLQIPQDGISAETTVPYFIKGGKQNILKFSAVIGSMMNLIDRKENEYLFKNNEKAFMDTVGHWAKKDIDFITARELLVGTAEGVFSPEAPLTRGMAVTILGRLWDADTSGFTSSRFTDVSNNAYYAPYVEWAAQNGIVAGVGNGQYAPDKVVSREEMAVILANFAEFTGIKLEEINAAAEAFEDEAQISPWAKADVRTIQKAGIISGKQDNLFDPKGKCTRAEISAILRRMIMNMVK